MATLVKPDSAKQSKRNLAIFFVSLFAILLASYRLNATVKRFSASKAKLSEAQYDLKRLDDILAKKADLESAYKLLNNSLPASFEEVAHYVSTLESLAESYKLTPELKIDESAIEEKKGLSSLRITIKANGTYEQLSSFMKDLANLAYHTRVDRLQIDKSEGATVMNVTLRLFINPAQKS